MQIATGLCARSWGPYVLRVALVAIAALAAIRPEPALAFRDYGFDPPSAAVSQPASHSSQQELFHTRAILIPTNRFRDQWAGLVKSLGWRKDELAACRSTMTCTPAASRWLSYLSQISSLPPKEQIALVNRYVNWHISYADDSRAYGAKDYWASPFQSMGGRGDCEDFATAKYFSLISLGFTDDQIRLVIVRDTRIDALHALTTVSIEGAVYVLDNRLVRVVRDKDISIYQPIYSFNQSQNWVHVTRDG
jgi:predicted transglutaminase-like cysteine proteinase